VNNKLKKIWTYMMEVLYWHLHVPLRLFIFQVSDLMFFCHGFSLLSHFSCGERSCLAHLHNYKFQTLHPPSIFRGHLLHQQPTHVTCHNITNPLKGLKYYTEHSQFLSHTNLHITTGTEYVNPFQPWTF
jgi:hypothetical protein